jgi:drug/metabolite transporter (DMT)-like permease
MATSQNKRAALTIVGAGLGFEVIAFIGNAVIAPGPRVAQMFALAIALGALIAVVGSVQLARAKGQPWFFGLLGLLSIVGVAVLWFLVPDKKTD